MTREVFEAILRIEDFENGSIKKYERTFDNWIYAPKKSSIVNVIGKLFNSKEKELKCIILCENNSSHISKKNEYGVFVNGIRIDKEDLEVYLSKTKR